MTTQVPHVLFSSNCQEAVGLCDKMIAKGRRLSGVSTPKDALGVPYQEL